MTDKNLTEAGVKTPDTSSERKFLLEQTTSVVLAAIAGSDIEAEAIPKLIQDVYTTFATLGTNGAALEPKVELIPAVPPKKSVFPDYIICLEDGKKLKLLRRHLKSTYNMTPEEYRQKWGLPASYPMVAPSYAEKRSNLAKTIGLGRRVGRVEAD